MTTMRSVAARVAAIGILIAWGYGPLGNAGAAQAATTHSTPANVWSWHGVRAAGQNSTSNCGKGVRPRKMVAKYKAKRHDKGGYREDILYCGNKRYGFRHLEPHIGQYFGGWGNFNFSMAQVLKKPANWVTQENGNFLESAPRQASKPPMPASRRHRVA
jgi:hypothetical protein